MLELSSYTHNRDEIVELYREKILFSTGRHQLLQVLAVIGAHYSSVSALHFPDTVNCQTCQNVIALWELL